MAAVTLPTIGPPCLTEGGLRLRYNPYAPSAKQAAFLALTCDEALYGGAAYGGKLLSVDTLVPTPTGFRKLGEIHPGDLVYGANGRPRLVEAEWEQSAPGYLLTFDDGSTVVANDEHLWITHTNAELQSAKRRTPEYRERRRAERPRRGTGKRPDLATRNAERPEPEATSTGTTRTTAEIVATLRDGRGRANHQIPVCAPLYRHDQQLPLDPYLLGVWLGDGTTLAGAITTMDLEIYDAFPRAGMQVSGLRGKEGTQASCFTAYGLVTILRYLGVLGDKHVPERYLWASEEQRVALLAGLIDTDGHVTADTGQVEFCNTNRQLADSVAHLARSLGMKAVVTVGRATLRGVDCGPKYRVKFTPNRSDISRLPRKRDHLKVGSTTRSSWRRIVSAERVDPQPMKCLRVSSPDHQFLVTEHLIPTHNSIALLMAALQFADVPGYNALIVRRSLADLELPDGLIDISKDWLSGTGATYNGNKHQWTFPSGATLTFGYLAHYGSETRYKSSQLQFIGFDELTEFPWEEQYEYLFSRLRRNTQAVGAAPDGTAMADVPLRVRGACVDEGEVLTVADGWKDIRDVQVGEQVYSVAEDGTLQSKRVTAHHAYDNDKPFVRVDMRNLSMSMTDDHRVTHLSFNSRHPDRRRYETLPYNEHRAACIDVARSPRALEAPGYTGDPLGWGTDVYLAYLGLFLAEGSTPPERRGNYKVLVTQCDAVGAGRVADLMGKVPLRSCRTAGGDFQITNKAAWEHFRSFGKAHEKYVPREVLSTATADQLRLLLDWLVFGDGHVRGDSIQYVTCSSRLADDVAEIGFKLGYKAKITRKELPNPNHNDRYTVYLTPGITTRVEKSGPRSPVRHEEFNGRVYCIEVADNHNFVLRQRGTVWISGNTNPGGVGMTWVKRRFVDPATAIAPFLPSKMTDNPGADEDYANSLAKLSEVERKRLQDGDWDVVEMPGALWKFKDFEWTDRLEPRPVSEVDVRVMSVDPAVTDETGKGDETGILMGSVTNGTLTVELDLSGKMHPDDWARLIVTAYNTWGCSSIIVEDNQGKALLNIALGNAADQLGLPRPTIYTITAKDSKEARAIPVVQAYRSTPRRVYHDLALKGGALEAQLTSWVPRRNTATIQSPDRLDALVWLVRHGLWNEGKSSGYRRARTAMAQMSGKMPGA